MNRAFVSLSDTEYADLARHGKVEFRLFCQKHDLPFHFPDVEKLDPKKSLQQSPFFFKAISIFNKANGNRIYTVNGKPVTFSYSFGGLDLEYRAYDPKELLHEYLELKAKQAVLKKTESFWIAASLAFIFLTGYLAFDRWAWLAFVVISIGGLFVWHLKQKQERNDAEREKTELEKEIILLRKELSEQKNC